MNKTPATVDPLLKKLDKQWAPVLCARCSTVMGARWAVQKKRRYCTNKCRQAAYRDRLSIR